MLFDDGPHDGETQPKAAVSRRRARRTAPKEGLNRLLLGDLAHAGTVILDLNHEGTTLPYPAAHRHGEAVTCRIVDDVVLTSSAAARVTASNRVAGKSVLRFHWWAALRACPRLSFDLKDALVGHGALTILSAGVDGRRMAETVEFGSGRTVVRAYARYADR